MSELLRRRSFRPIKSSAAIVMSSDAGSWISSCCEVENVEDDREITALLEDGILSGKITSIILRLSERVQNHLDTERSSKFHFLLALAIIGGTRLHVRSLSLLPSRTSPFSFNHEGIFIRLDASSTPHKKDALAVLIMENGIGIIDRPMEEI